MTERDSEGREIVRARAKGLTPQMREAAALAAIGSTPQEIADTVRFSKTTVLNWAKRADYCAELDRLVSETQRVILRRGQSHAARASEFLMRIVDDESAPLGERRQAASKLIDRLPKIAAEHLAEPVPDSALMIANPRPLTALEQAAADETLLEVVKTMREVQQGRAVVPTVTYHGDDYPEDEPEDEDSEEDHRTIAGELAEDEPEPVDEPQGTARRKSAPVDEAEVRSILYERGGGRRVG